MNREELLEQLVRELVNCIRVLLTEKVSDEGAWIGNNMISTANAVLVELGLREQRIEDMP
jgi:hypothetical protein